MKKVILDTNFILACVKQKIDFFKEIFGMGLEIIIPNQVIEEIVRISNSNKKLKFKEDAKLAQIILEKNKFKKINIIGDYVDKGLINYAKEHPEVIIATLDRDIKNKIKNPKLVIRRKKRLEIV